MEALAAGMAIAIVFVYFRVYPLLFKHFINFIKSKDSDVFPGIYFTVFAILSTILLTVLCLIGMIIAFEDIDDNLLFTILALTAVISLSFLSIIYLTIRKKLISVFCKYCGKIIDDDSRFCRFCGEDISSSNSLLYSTEKTHIANKSIRNDKRLIEKWNKATNYIKPKFVWIWKVIKTIGLIIVGITAWTIIGVFYAPFIALFNAEIPDLGIFEDIQKIWRKD